MNNISTNISNFKKSSDLPYFYDDLWKKHEIKYHEFYGYKYIKDLSYKEPYIHSNILLLEFNDELVLRGFGKGILFPYVSNMDIINIHSKKKTILSIYNYIFDIIQKYNIKNTKIYQYPYYSFIAGYNILDRIGIKNNNICEQILYYDKVPENITSNMKLGTRRIINSYLKKKICDYKINIYFGQIPDNIFDKFIDKHFELSQSKTKPDICWDIIKEFIKREKAILVEGNNNFVYFLLSEHLCSYGINACSRRDPIVTILIYHAIKWIFDKGYKLIWFDKYETYFDNEKEKNISIFKNGFCNKLINNYYISY